MSRRTKIRVAVVSLVVAILVLIPLSLRWHAQWQLNAYRKKLIAAGEKLTIEELAPKPKQEATNGALFVRLASSLRAFDDYWAPLLKEVKPGAARAVWREAEATTEIPQYGNSKTESLWTNLWPGLEAGLRTNEQTLDEIEALVDTGSVAFNVDYSPFDITSLNYLALVKRVESTLVQRAIFEMHSGQMDGAYRDLISSVAGSDLLAKQPLQIYQLVRYANLSIAMGGYWQALQAEAWTDKQLAQFQTMWEKQDVLEDAVSALEMERAGTPMIFQAARASRDGFSQIAGSDVVKVPSEIWNDFLLHAGDVPRELLDSCPRYWGWRWIWSYRDECSYLSLVQNLIDQLRATPRRPVPGRRNEDELARKSIDVTEALTGNLERFVALARQEQTSAHIVITAIALERYKLAHSNYPETLARLVPEFVRSVPVDCIDGADLRYRLNANGTYLLYSIGEDGIDNGGDATPKKDFQPSFSKGADWVWPRAATAEEVQAYEADLKKKAKQK